MWVLGQPVWGVQKKRIKGHGSIESGFIILASHDEDLKRESDSLDRGILNDLTHQTNDDLVVNLLQLYWANYNVENTMKNWDDYITKKMNEINEIVTQQNKNKIKSLFELNTLIVNEYRDFEGYKLKEDQKYDYFNTNIIFNKRFNKSRISDYLQIPYF